MLSRISKENQHIYINSKKVLGVQNFTASYNTPIEQIKYLGMEKVSYYNNSNSLAEINISKLLIDKDEFVNFIDYDQGFSGHIDYKNKYFAFNSGILTRYNLSCAVGEIPQLNLDISAIGDFGTGIDRPAKESITVPDIDVTDYSNIEINLDDFKFNRLQSFELNISAEKNVIYTLGNVFPTQIKVVPPIIVEIEFGIKADDYNLKNIKDLICKYKVDDFKIVFNKFKKPEEELFRFDFSGALFMGESFGGDVSSSSDVKIKYHAFLYNKRTPPISNPLPLGELATEPIVSGEDLVSGANILPIGDANSIFPSKETNILNQNELRNSQEVFKLKPAQEDPISSLTFLPIGDTTGLFPSEENAIQSSTFLNLGETASGFSDPERTIFNPTALAGAGDAYIFRASEEAIISSSTSLATGDTTGLFPSEENAIQSSTFLNLGETASGFSDPERTIFNPFNLPGPSWKEDSYKFMPTIETSINISINMPKDPKD